MEVIKIDERRSVVIGGNHQETIRYAAEEWIKIANESIERSGSFVVALSGGSTPKLIYQELKKATLPWEKIFLFWSDERAVPPDSTESNYHMAMSEAGLNSLPIPKENIFRMQAESDIEKNAVAYEKALKKFDLIMLGMGEDGHTASLFPHTDALHVVNRLVVANYVPQKKSWRMSFTFECINQARHICVYALGKEKAEMLARVLKSPFNPDELPLQRVGTVDHKALFIIDEEAGKGLKSIV
jgi:6-phosphogluconolactonase